MWTFVANWQPRQGPGKEAEGGGQKSETTGRKLWTLEYLCDRGPGERWDGVKKTEWGEKPTNQTNKHVVFTQETHDIYTGNMWY